MEKFIVSARKYRPQTFATVVGQEHITTTLKNAIKSGHLAHAFLFCGPRGVGKTTCARILAKTINCENSSEGEACNKCSSCKSFNEGSSMNIHELDAASNNSVEDIRSLVDQVRFSPQAGRYKVYIIDEVHMLSSSAFNAFLKTLEEPPPYAIFILATTEKHKILPTILSRCQIFDFKRITLQDTVEHLQEIAVKEKIKVDEAALQLIAQKSEGCMRDALSILDKIVSFTNGIVTYDNTIEHLNILDADYYFRLIDCMLNQDLSGAMLLYDDIDKKGFEGDMVLNGFAEFIRNLLICKDERVVHLLEAVESFKLRYAQTAKKTEPEYLISSLNILNEAEINYRSARNKRLHVELALIKLCYLGQALLLVTGNEGQGSDKKKLVDKAKAVSFKTIQPIATRQQVTEKEIPSSNIVKPGISSARLIVETDKKEEKLTPVIENEKRNTGNSIKNNSSIKLGSLEAIRQKIQKENSSDVVLNDQPLEINSLKIAWVKFIEYLKENKNPASQSFISATLNIKDTNSFEAVVTNNISYRFIEFERNQASEFLQKELSNRQLQFTIAITGNTEDAPMPDVPLNSRQQFEKIVEQYPLVKELKDRLRLELDY
ncbi:MAG TPA: DNA polymerase III subunit gamma/tau [Flavisolibacter sp.]|nr:DNA polymerase III subunit gamma/tau [Flavisolibacter sp.]